MLRSFSSAHAKSCITLLLWAHILGVTIARRVVVDDSETDKIIYSTGWTGNHGCFECTHASSLPHNGTWHSYSAGISPYLVEILGFSFKFNGTSVEGRFIVPCLALAFKSVSVQYWIDDVAQSTVTFVWDCPEPGYLYNQSLFSVPKLPSGEHTLRVAPAALLWFDYLIYEAEDPIGTVNSTSEATGTGGKAAHTNTTTNLSTSINPTSSNPEIPQESSAPSTNLALLVGGIVSGIIVLALAILGVLWHRSKSRSKKSERQWPPSLSSELSPEPTPRVPKTMSVSAYDPPGYTEKNAYFGIQSLWGNSRASGAKGPVPP